MKLPVVLENRSKKLAKENKFPKDKKKKKSFDIQSSNDEG